MLKKDAVELSSYIQKILKIVKTKNKLFLHLKLHIFYLPSSNNKILFVIEIFKLIDMTIIHLNAQKLFSNHIFVLLNSIKVYQTII